MSLSDELARTGASLTDDDVLVVAAGLTSRCAVPAGGFRIGVAITYLTGAMPHPDDVARVRSCLLAAGWPADDVFGTAG